MFGLTDEEVKDLSDSMEEIKQAFENEDLDLLQSWINIYLITDECMWYDEDGENWYTERGKYVQSLYDKIILWTYED